jgi:RNA polymerase sigma-70 factor (ECF subfamily)
LATPSTARFPLIHLTHGTVSAESTSPTKISDELLLARVKCGDPDALTFLFRRYSSLARGIGRRILRDNGEAEDLVQEVFLFLHRNASVFDSSKSTARSWIVQIIYYQAISRRRYLSSRQFYVQADCKESSGDVDVRGRKDEHSGEALFDRVALAEVLGTLTEDQRETLRLYFFEGHTLNEISAKLNEPLGNVRHHYYRGLDKLRERLFGCRLRD